MFVAWDQCELRPFLRGILLTDISLNEPSALTARAETARRGSAGDTRFRYIALAAAIAVLVIFAGVIASLIVGAWPSFKEFGFSFIWTEVWKPTKDKFGALGLIYGTLVTSIIAMVIAVPVGHRHRHLPDRPLPAAVAPSHRHRRRAAGGHSLHHLRHLGACSCSRPGSRSMSRAR